SLPTARRWPPAALTRRRDYGTLAKAANAQVSVGTPIESCQRAFPPMDSYWPPPARTAPSACGSQLGDQRLTSSKGQETWEARLGRIRSPFLRTGRCWHPEPTS